MLYESINAISNAKNLEDKYQYEISQQKEIIKILRTEKLELEMSNRLLFADKNQAQEEANALNNLKIQMEGERIRITSQAK